MSDRENGPKRTPGRRSRPASKASEGTAGGDRSEGEVEVEEQADNGSGAASSLLADDDLFVSEAPAESEADADLFVAADDPPAPKAASGPRGGRDVAGLVDRVRNLGPVGAVLAALVAFELFITRHLLSLASWPNDLPFHLSMVDWASGRWEAGQVPVDGWYPRLSGGLPQFHLYQSLPHVLTGALGTMIGSQRALHLTLWLLVGTWPIAVYLGARALGLSKVASVGAAVSAPLLRSATGYGFEPFSYMWLGNGLWSQAWGMWVAPLALGWSARAVRTGEGYGRAVAAVGLTVAFHLPTAWFVLVALGLWLLVRPGAWRTTGPRAIGLGILSVLASAWVLVPFLVDRWASNVSSFNDQGHFSDSFGARRVMGWFLAGDVLDAGRVPVLSVLAGVGLVLALLRWRTDRPGEREVVAVVALSLVLFIGRDPMGPLIALLPGSSQVFLHRYVATLQYGLLLLIGVAVDGAWRWWKESSPGLDARPLVRFGAVALVACGVLFVPVRSTVRLLDRDRAAVDYQQGVDRTTGREVAELVAIAEARGGGRISGGRLYGAGRTFRVGSVPVPIWLSQVPVDAIGFTLRVSALSADLETYIDDTSVADLDAFGVRFVLVPRGTTAPRGTWFLAARGDYQLWEVPGDGYLSVADLLGPPLKVANTDLAADLLPVMRSQGGSPTAVRQVDLDGRSPTVTATADGPGESPGNVVTDDLDLDAGKVSATVDLERDAALVIKANWHPRWKATVDGKAVPVVAVAPTWTAIPVPAGEHQVRLTYAPWSGTWLLGPLALLAVAAGWAWSRRARGRSSADGVTAISAATEVGSARPDRPHAGVEGATAQRRRGVVAGPAGEPRRAASEPRRGNSNSPGRPAGGRVRRPPRNQP